MSKQLFEKLLNDYKRSNKDRKEKLANKSGFSTGEQYESYLKAMINSSYTIVSEVPVGLGKASEAKKEIPTIHIVDIIDCSASMMGSKINSAIEGINKGIKDLQSKNDAKYLYTLCDFSSYGDIKYLHSATPINIVDKIEFKTRSATALYQASCKTIDLMDKIIANSGNKVLVNIYTDGEDNNSREFTNEAPQKIKAAQENGYTITFIGTDRDVERMINTMHIDRSNTLAYDGTSQGLYKSMSLNSMARSTFSSAVAEGKDVSKGFYKEVIKK